MLALHRFGDPGELRTEHVCQGCLRRSEKALVAKTDDAELIAFVLAALDAVDRLELSLAKRQQLVSALKGDDG